MASLGLDAKWINDATLRITWNDVKANHQKTAVGVLIGIIGAAGFVVSLFVTIASGNFTLMGLVIIGVIASVLWWRVGTSSTPNAVEFTAETITVQNKKYPTPRVTRFDFGAKSQLTGMKPKRDGHGNDLSDPTMIRMWVDDSVPITVSENNWSFDTCHTIRDALDRALQQVREGEKAAAKEAKFGKDGGKFGVPDY